MSMREIAMATGSELVPFGQLALFELCWSPLIHGLDLMYSASGNLIWYVVQLALIDLPRHRGTLGNVLKTTFGGCYVVLLHGSKNRPPV